MPLDDVRVQYIDSWESAAAFGQWMAAQTHVAIDTETTGLDTYRDRVRILQVGNETEAWVLPIEGPDSWAGLAIDVLRRYERLIDMHHLKYDVNMIDTTLGVTLD